MRKGNLFLLALLCYWPSHASLNSHPSSPIHHPPSTIHSFYYSRCSSRLTSNNKNHFTREPILTVMSSSLGLDAKFRVINFQYLLNNQSSREIFCTKFTREPRVSKETEGSEPGWQASLPAQWIRKWLFFFYFFIFYSFQPHFPSKISLPPKFRYRYRKPSKYGEQNGQIGCRTRIKIS